MTLCGKECYGWWADRQALDNACETCKVKEFCYKRWVEDGGKVGGYFDKARESEKNKRNIR